MTAPRITAERIAELKRHYPRGAYSPNREHHPFGHIAYSTIDIHELVGALESAYAERDELAAQVERFKTGAVRVSLDGKVYFEPYVQHLKLEIDRLRSELAARPTTNEARG